MGWREDLEAAAEWARHAWDDLDEDTRRRIREALRQLTDPWFYIDLAREHVAARFRALERRLTEYLEDPGRIYREFLDAMMPRSRFGELAERLLPGRDVPDGFGPEISRPVILIPGMVGTRLMRPEGARAGTPSGIPPDHLQRWMERQFRSEESDVLRDLPRGVREALLPVLSRISDRHLYNPRVVWDPDSYYALFDLMNKTATERGALFCPDDTEAVPATDFATEVAESMTIEGWLGIWYGPLRGRILREIVRAVGGNPGDGLRADRRFEALRERRRRRGWCQPVWDISKDWLLPLEHSFGETIYAFGYDWRQPLSRAVSLLVRKIERVKARHRGRSPILVTHSFGGLLARAAARRVPDAVGGIVQIFSPTAGAIKPFANFKKGGGGTIPGAWDAEEPPDPSRLQEYFNVDALSAFAGFDGFDAAFAMFLGWDANAFAATSAGAYGLYSLLPNNVRRFGQDAHWLRIENDSTLAAEVAASHNVYDLYEQFDRPWGLLDGSVWSSGNPVQTGDDSERAWRWLLTFDGAAGSLVRMLHSLHQDGSLRVFRREMLTAAQARTVTERVRRGIRHARELSAEVGDYVHPNTWSVWGSGLDTDAAFTIRRLPGAGPASYASHRVIDQNGDGTLEIPSARALSRRIHHEQELPGLIHAKAMNLSPDARDALVDNVFRAMVVAHNAERRGARP